jgi:hypothetical protein
MCRRLIVAVTTIAATLAVPAHFVFAAGAPVRKPPTSVGMAPPAAPAAPSTPSVQGTGPEQLLGGCGRGRVRDPRTNQCRGPADIGR